MKIRQVRQWHMGAEAMGHKGAKAQNNTGRLKNETVFFIECSGC
jgi:hypothetical protein